MTLKFVHLSEIFKKLHSVLQESSVVRTKLISQNSAVFSKFQITCHIKSKNNLFTSIIRETFKTLFFIFKRARNLNQYRLEALVFTWRVFAAECIR